MNTVKSSLDQLRRGAHADVEPSIDAAYRAAHTAALTLETLARDKKGNLKVAADALAAAQKDIDMLALSIQLEVADKEKELAALEAPGKSTN